MNNELKIRNYFIDAIARISQNKLPVVLYGAGMLAERLYAYLEKYGISVDAIVVDERFLPHTPTFAGHTVVSLESNTGGKIKKNYIIGFGTYGDRQALRARLEPVAAEIVLFDVGYGAVDDIDHQIAFYSSYATVNKQGFERTLALLEDARSRETLSAFISQKISGSFGEYEKYYCPDQYFPDELFSLRNGEIFVDCGAFTGDSIAVFQQKLARDGISDYDAIYAFEPELDLFTKLAAATENLPRCYIFQQGLWHEAGRFAFKSSASSSSISQTGDKFIDVVALDAALPESGCTFIKMDIEGAELQALRGARRTITRHKPILAISLYHKPEDILTIPNFIKTLDPEYRLYVRAHFKPVTIEMVLYAIPARGLRRGRDSFSPATPSAAFQS
jgi:FkbM family methyltransferase